MNHWTELLGKVDARPIQAVYGENLPSLNGVEIAELRLDARGRDLILCLNLAEYPQAPPRKWAAKNANTVSIELRLLTLSALAIDGTPAANPVNISLHQQDGRIHTSVQAKSITLEAEANFVSLGSLVAYRRADSSGDSKT